MLLSPSRSPLMALGLALCVAPSLAAAQGAAAGAAPRPITAADISAWKTLRGATLSNNGQWFAYLQAPNEGDAEVIVRQTAATGTPRRIPVGEVPAAGGFGGGVPGLQLSGDGKWLAVLVYPKAAEQKRLRQQRRPIQSKALVVNLVTGEQREFDRIRRIAFGGDTPSYLAMQAYGPDAPAGGGGGAGGPAAGAPGMGGNLFGGGGARVDGTDLLLHELGTANVMNVGNVGDFAFSDFGHQAIDQDRFSAEFVTAMNHGYLAGDVSQIERFFDGRIAATHNSDFLIAVKEAIAGRAGRNTIARQRLFARNAKPPRLRAGGDHHGFGHEHIAAIGVAAEGALAEIDLCDDIMDHGGADMLGLGPHLIHQPGALHGLGEAGVVLDIGGDGQLPARLQAGHQHGTQPGARGVDRGRVAGGAGTDDEKLGLVRGGHGRIRWLAGSWRTYSGALAMRQAFCRHMG